MRLWRFSEHIIASHLADIVPAIANDPRVSLVHFAADVTGDRPRFDYRLRAGASAQRLGMTLLKQERVLDLLDQATASSQALSVPALHPSAGAFKNGAGGLILTSQVRRRHRRRGPAA